eukprot:5630690-Amphidinium_carterae.1
MHPYDSNCVPDDIEVAIKSAIDLGPQGVRNKREELLLKYEGIAVELTQQEEDLKREMPEWRR